LKIQDKDYILSKHPIISNHSDDVGEVPANNSEPNNTDIHEGNVDNDEDTYIPEPNTDNHEDTYVPKPNVNNHEELPICRAPSTSPQNNVNLNCYGCFFFIIKFEAGLTY
jgi:hypothetical protein